MIKLSLPKHCDNCTEFEPEVNRYSYFSNLGVEMCNTTVRCQHEFHCNKIVDYLKIQLEK